MLALLATVALLGPPKSTPKPGDLTELSFRRRVTRTVAGKYLLYLPPDYGKAGHERWPLVLFLHGSGEAGDSTDDLRRNGPPHEIVYGRKFPFILVVPLSPSETDWDPYPLTALLNEVEARTHVDRDREYVTGLSMGGIGTYRLAALTPERFAAIAPIAGGEDARMAALLLRIPIWAFHGERDPVVPIGDEQPLIDNLKKLGADVTYTVVPGGGHDVWTQIYSGTEIYDWLLSHTRPHKDGGNKDNDLKTR